MNDEIFEESAQEVPCYNLEEKVGLEDFLGDIIPNGEQISVDANWLQRKLKEMYKLQLDNNWYKEREEKFKRDISQLYTRIENLNTSVEIMKLKTKPKTRVTRVLDIYS